MGGIFAKSGGHEDDGNNIIAIVLVRGKAAAMRTIAMIPFRIIAIVLMKGILIDFRYPDQSGARGESFLHFFFNFESNVAIDLVLIIEDRDRPSGHRELYSL